MPAVLDASVLADILVFSPRGQRASELIHATAPDLHLPHLADIETTSVLRNLLRAGILSADRAEAALADLRDFPAKRWPAPSFLERVWELRDNATPYDAVYVALAEVLDAEFITADVKLARGLTGMARCRVVLVS
jgi:predicted nucleic acid-binding protein